MPLPLADMPTVNRLDLSPATGHTSPAAPIVAFWADALRTTALQTNSTFPLRTVPAPPPSISPADHERWELLTALAHAIEGPPTAAQLDLLQHLAPPPASIPLRH